MSRRAAGQDRRQLPGEIDRVADAGVHALAAGRAVDVRGVAEQEGAAVAEMLGHPVMHVIGREPVHLARPRTLRCSIARSLTSSNVSVSARSARSSRTVPIRRARPVARQREDAEEVGLVEIDVQFAVDRGPGRLDVGDVEELPIGAAGKAGADRLAHDRAGAVAAGDVGGLAVASAPSGPRSRAMTPSPSSAKPISSVLPLDRDAERLAAARSAAARARPAERCAGRDRASGPRRRLRRQRAPRRSPFTHRLTAGTLWPRATTASARSSCR